MAAIQVHNSKVNRTEAGMAKATKCAEEAQEEVQAGMAERRAGNTDGRARAMATAGQQRTTTALRR